MFTNRDDVHIVCTSQSNWKSSTQYFGCNCVIIPSFLTTNTATMSTSSDNLYRNQYRIQSARATWHDYNGGAYFVTICTRNMEHYFGEIVDGKMNQTEIGRYADEQLRNVSSHYPYAEIPLWVVMPNHIHAIVRIDDEIKRTNGDVQTMCTSSPKKFENLSIPANETMYTSSVRPNPLAKNEWMQSISQRRGMLSTVIGGLKRAVTHFARTHSISFFWLPRFHDHIIRDRDEMNRIAEYIENNVAQWESDKFYS